MKLLKSVKFLGITGTGAGGLGIVAGVLVPGSGLTLAGAALALAFLGYRQQTKEPDAATPFVAAALLSGMVVLLVSIVAIFGGA